MNIPDIDNPEIKSQIMALIPFFDKDDPSKIADAINTKLSPELKKTAIEFGNQIHDYLGAVLDAIDPLGTAEDLDSIDEFPDYIKDEE